MSHALTLHVDSKFISPWALTAFVGLEEKQLPYTLATYSLEKKETFAAGYDAVTQRVPALQRGAWWLSESVAIVEYLAESFPFPNHPRLFPENLEQRARCREVMLWLRTDLLPLRAERPTTTVWGPRATTPLTTEGEASAQRLISVATRLVGERTTLCDAWCIADVDLTVALQRLQLNGYPLPTSLQRYATTNWERPSLAKWHALAANSR